jgi:predicted dithiol-disulfide oxidoreductase (DUF899 family)
MTNKQTLTPADDMAQKSDTHFPNESAEYRQARKALLAEEIELRRHIQRVAEQRRQLPPGGEITKAYQFEGEGGPVTFVDLFGEKETLIVYSFMFGPEREEMCPMCNSFMNAWERKVPDIRQRAAFVMIARSPIERIKQLKQERGWKNLQLYSDPSGDYTRDYVSAEDEDIPAYNVFMRKGDTIRHFWGSEMGAETADPGQDPRGAPDLDPLWTLLDTTPEGRGTDWYPKLDYSETEKA